MNFFHFKKIITFLSLFGSLGTLICCALPLTLAMIGLGSVFASLTSIIPQIVWISEKKLYLFAFTGVLLIFSYILIGYAERRNCPSDKNQEEVCKKAKNRTLFIFYSSVVLYALGFFFAYVLHLFI